MLVLKLALNSLGSLFDYQLIPEDFSDRVKSSLLCKNQFGIRGHTGKAWEPIRIEASTEDLRLTVTNDTLLTSLTDELIPEVVEYFAKVLTVQRSTTPLVLENRCSPDADTCNTATSCPTPAKYLGKSGGVEADLVLLFTFSTFSCDESSIAWSRACSPSECERPFHAQVNICPGLFESFTRSAQKSILVHEVTHALGFNAWVLAVEDLVRSSPLVGYFEANTFLRCPMLCAYFPRIWGCPECVPRIVSPNAVVHAREFFGCDSLNSVELVMWDGDCHWSPAIMEDSMDPYGDSEALLSTMTLALLEDTGLYKPNYSMAAKPVEGVTSGYKGGCDAALGILAETDAENP